MGAWVLLGARNLGWGLTGVGLILIWVVMAGGSGVHWLRTESDTRPSYVGIVWTWVGSGLGFALVWARWSLTERGGEDSLALARAVYGGAVLAIGWRFTMFGRGKASLWPLAWVAGLPSLMMLWGAKVVPVMAVLSVQWVGLALALEANSGKVGHRAWAAARPVFRVGLVSFGGTQLMALVGRRWILSSLDFSASFVGMSGVFLAVNGFLLWMSTWGGHALGLSWLTRSGGFYDALERERTFSLGFSYFALTMTQSTIAVAAHRRHLMVWAVFAPRWMFDVSFSFIGLVLLLLWSRGSGHAFSSHRSDKRKDE